MGKRFFDNLHICHRCELHDRGICTAGGQAIATHARMGCPHPEGPRFEADPQGPPPRLVQVIPEDFDPEVERRRLQSGGCCGAPSHMR